MKILQSAIYLIVAAGFFFVLCGVDKCGPVVGGPCSYSDFAGTVEIIRVVDADPGAYNCKDAVEVLFDFVPDDPSDIDHYRFPGTSNENNRLTVSSGQNPPRSWIEDEGIAHGSKLKCVRREIKQDTCTPVIFFFPDLDYSKATELCH